MLISVTKCSIFLANGRFSQSRSHTVYQYFLTLSFPSDFISNMDIFMAMLHLLRQAPFNVRSTLCQLFNSILYHTPEDVVKISALPGWEVMFFYLLTPFSLSLLSETPRKPQPSDPERETVSVKQDCPTESESTSTPSTVVEKGGCQEGDSPPSNDMPPPPTSMTSSDDSSPSTEAPKMLCSINSKRAFTLSNTSESLDNETYLLIEDTDVCKTKPDPRNLTLPISKSSYRSRSNVCVVQKPGARKSYHINEKNELFPSPQRQVSLVVSTPWAETKDSFVDEEMSRTVDVVVQMIKQVLWVSMVDVPSWKVRHAA